MSRRVVDRKRRSPILKLNQGLTLVEVMVAMLILASALGSFLSVFMMNQKTIVYANNQLCAVNLARGRMETLLGYSYNDAMLSTGTHVVTSGSYNITQTNSLKTITLTVNWTNPLPRKVVSYVLTTKISQAIHQ